MEILFAHALEILFFFSLFVLFIFLGFLRNISIVFLLALAAVPTTYILSIFPYKDLLYAFFSFIPNTDIISGTLFLFLMLIYFFAMRKILHRTYYQKSIFYVLFIALFSVTIITIAISYTLPHIAQTIFSPTIQDIFSNETYIFWILVLTTPLFFML